jgi:hypothetical protein
MDGLIDGVNECCAVYAGLRDKGHEIHEMDGKVGSI